MTHQAREHCAPGDAVNSDFPDQVNTQCEIGYGLARLPQGERLVFTQPKDDVAADAVTSYGNG
ncbi:MAG TPA: hypothetical protein VN946_08680, partial [Terriglobales bacterium]|nr:hypothetical protein [Terriglobales bacterium]